MYLELSLVFLSAAVFLIAAVTAPLLFQIMKIIRGLAMTQEALQKSLPGILQNLDEAIGNIKKTTITVNEQVEAFALAMGKVQALFSVVMELENVLRLGLRLPFINFLRTSGAVAKGIRVFLNVYASGSGRR